MLEIRHLAHPGLTVEPLVFKPGEIIAIAGPSGAGKSLLLRAIADLDPNQGEVLLNGKAREAMPAPEWRRQVIYVAAVPGWWAPTVAAQIPSAELARAEVLLQALDLPREALRWPVERLSTGEGQRLSLIRALLFSPPVLLLDEPTSALDPDSAMAVEAMLRERADNGAIVLLVTHDRRQAERLATRRLAVAAGGHVTEAA